MISQTQTASNQYGFYAVPKKLEPKKKYRDEEYEDIMDNNYDQEQENQFHPIQRTTQPENQIEPDYYINQAPYPQFKPKQSGLDYGVQVQNGELIDFDLEVTPLLEIIVGRCVVSAINQLQQEKQKVEKKQQTQSYRKKRNAELMVTQRLQAKSKRKHEQTQRRQLQQSIHHKNNRHLHEKILSRKLAKTNLLNLSQDVILQLQQDGMLRYQPTLQLRINYEGWLYDEITKIISQQHHITQCANRIVNELQEDDEEKHKRRIQKEKQRRRQIILQRERIQRMNQERRQKKRIRKYRQNLHQLRSPLVDAFEQLLDGSSEIDSVLKHSSFSDGFVTNNNHGNVNQQLHVSGGLFSYILVLLNSTQQVHHTPDQLEQLLIKVINQLNTPLEIQLQKDQANIIKQELQEMERNPNQFMIDKVSRVAEIAKKVSLNLSLISLSSIEVKPLLHQALILALLNIYFTTTKIPTLQQQQQLKALKEKQENEQQSKPQQQLKTQQQQQQQKLSNETQQQVALYSPTEQDKFRQTVKQKILFKSTDNQELLKRLQHVLRVRFERQSQQPQQSNQQDANNNSKQDNIEKKPSTQNQQPQTNQQQQWIDIFDGQGWNKHKQKHPNELERNTQKPAVYSITGFNNSFVYDERVLYYLSKELERVLEIQSGEEIEKYRGGLANLAAKIGKNIPVIDGELRTLQ